MDARACWRCWIEMLQRTWSRDFHSCRVTGFRRAMLQWAEGILTVAEILPCLVLVSNVLFFGFLAFTRLGNLYYDASLPGPHCRASVCRRQWGHGFEASKTARLSKTFSYPIGPDERIHVNLLSWLDYDTPGLSW